MPDLYDYIDRDPFCYDRDERRMLVTTHVYDDQLGEMRITCKAKFEVCDYCGGSGSHSLHLGSFTADEFDDAFPEDEDREAYFSGRHDMPCEFCRGKRVLLVPDWEENEPFKKALWEQAEQEHYAYEAERLAEIRMGA